VSFSAAAKPCVAGRRRLRSRTALREIPRAFDYHGNRTKEKAMSDSTVDALIVDLLAWLSARDRTYQEVIDVWRTSCPKLPVWEDAKDRGFVSHEYFNGSEIVKITSAGFAFLEQRKITTKTSSPRLS
jgi:hypothetical protein